MIRRRSDGKFGRESLETGEATGNTGRFQKGQSGNENGRPKGSRNKKTADFEALMMEYADTFGNPSKRPADQLACLLWIQMHPLAGLDQICDAAWKGAQFKYARKQHITGEIVDIEARNRRILEGQKRVAEDRIKREAEEKQRPEGSANDATKTDTQTDAG